MKKLVRLMRKDGRALYLDPELVTKVDSTADEAVSLVITRDFPRPIYVKGTADDVYAQLAGAGATAQASESGVTLALEIAGRYGHVDGDHHKTWTIDQMVRALTGCPFQRVGEHPVNRRESDEYKAWVVRARAGEEGPNTYDWDVGTAP